MQSHLHRPGQSFEKCLNGAQISYELTSWWCYFMQQRSISRSARPPVLYRGRTGLSILHWCAVHTVVVLVAPGRLRVFGAERGGIAPLLRKQWDGPALVTMTHTYAGPGSRVR